MMRLGRHMPTNSNPLKAAAQAREIGCNAMQIFASNPTAWSPTQGGEEGCLAFAEAARAYDLTPIVLHAPYLINLAAPDEAVWDKSVALHGWCYLCGVPRG